MARFRRQFFAIVYFLGRLAGTLQNALNHFGCRLGHLGRSLHRWLSSGLGALLGQLTRRKLRSHPHPLPRRSRRWLSPRLRQQAGFILPTTALLLVVVALTITALSLRSLNRTVQVAGDRQQKVIYNAATPAIDRARAKLERMFVSDSRIPPSGAPGEEYLISMMLNDGGAAPALEDRGDPYTLPDEERTSGDANIWSYRTDTDGDGTEDATVVYSINMRALTDEEIEDTNPNVVTFAEEGKTRTGPLSATGIDEKCNVLKRLGLPRVEGGWYQSESTTATLRKNFQVDAVVIVDDGAGVSPGIQTAATLEFQQDRIAESGNKWGAWFQYDLELFPGGVFNWNGAMHSEGNMFITGSTSRGQWTDLYLVSDEGSCLYEFDEASEITVGAAPRADEKDFTQGEFIASALSGPNKNFAGREIVRVHYKQDGSPVQTPKANFTPATDSVNAGGDASKLALDPKKLFTQGLRAINDPKNYRVTNWDAIADYRSPGGRVANSIVQRPYLDDFYRADDRYGPRPNYGKGSEREIPAGSKVGDGITGDIFLTRNKNTEDPTGLGLDGYWERRAIREGMRVITGERLQLGADTLNPLGYPHEADEFDKTRPHQVLQRRAERDPLAAVQGTLVYHHSVEDGVNPVGVIATTVHPGTPETLKRSATAEKVAEPLPMRGPQQGLFGPAFGDDEDELAIDFFNGRGTNGWEFDVNQFNNLFDATLQENGVALTVDSTMDRALGNLAEFAGDPDGAFPAKQEAGKVHPLPEMTKWGNYANLRRALSGNGNESPADQSTKQSAGLSLGMLAYNLSYLNGIDYGAGDLPDQLTQLAAWLGNIGDSDLVPVTGSNADPSYALNRAEDDELTKFRGSAALEAARDLKTGTEWTDQPVAQGQSLYRLLTQNAGVLALSKAPRPEDLAQLPLSEANYAKSKEEQIKRYGHVDLARNLDDDSGSPFTVRVYPKGVEVKNGDLGRTRTAFTQRLSKLDGETPSPYYVKTTLPKVYDALPGDQKARLEKLLDVPPIPPEAYLAAMSESATPTAPRTADLKPPTANANGLTNLPELQYLAKLVALREQTERDRTFGFAPVRSGIGTDVAPEVETNFTYKIRYAYPKTGSVNYTGLGEDLDDNGVLDVVGDLNSNGVIDIGPVLVGGELKFETEDTNGNGLLDAENEIPDATGQPKVNYTLDFDTDDKSNQPLLTSNEDVNQNGVLDETEDKNGNGLLDAPWFAFGGRTYYQNGIYEFGCDFSEATGNNYFGFGKPENFAEERRFIYLAASLCPVEAKYPSLYYVFPKYDHPFAGEKTSVAGVDVYDATETVVVDHTQPLDPDDPELGGYSDRYLSDDDVQDAVGASTFQAFDAGDLATIAIKPLTPDDWQLPHTAYTPTDDCGKSAPICMQYSVVALDDDPLADPLANRYYRLGFKDAAFYEGRDRLATRTLDIDLDMLRDATYADALNDDLWLAVGDMEEQMFGGIIYAAREDALREDGIARPAGADQTTVTSYPGQDPAVDGKYGISVKPVDYYPDPDRRVSGFRLKNGIELRRKGRDEDSPSGLEVITDNPLFVKGDFNLHRKGEGDNDQIEEFQTKLQYLPSGLYNNFYNRSTKLNPNLDEDFARPDRDRWRPTTLLADTVSPLSDAFCDGSIIDGLTIEESIQYGLKIEDDYGCMRNRNGNVTSFLNQANRPSTASEVLADWWHESRFDNTSPVAYSAIGLPVRYSSTEVGDDQAFTPEYYPGNGYAEIATDRRAFLNTYAIETKMNAMMIAGVGPSRTDQSYGGFHNFPSFLESWSVRRGTTYPLNFAGAFLQLNFRTTSTGPYDQDAWEADEKPRPGEDVFYYRPPSRQWGYDPALQLLPAGAIASRFTTVGNNRSEFYDEPPADDPYICRLGEAVGQTLEGCD